MRKAPINRPVAAVTVRAVGCGGVDEARGFLDDEEVVWALLRMQMGSGAFARIKFIAVHFNGDDVPVVRRGRLNSNSAEVLAHFGQVHATLEFKRKEEFTVDSVCEQLLPVLTSDSNLEGSGPDSQSAQSLKQMYEAIISEQKKAALGKRMSLRAGPRTARECGPGRRVTAAGALAAVAKSRGQYNWVLLEPTQLELHNAGYGGLDELKAWLEDDKVLFGVIRFSFGNGKSSDTDCVKYVFVHWVGPSVPAVRRGQWNMQHKEADTMVRKFCTVIIMQKEVHTPSDLDVGQIISEIQRLSVVDGTAGGSADSISLDKYIAALEEECREGMQADVSDGEEGAAPQALPDVSAAVEAVRKADDGAWNWLLLGLGPQTPAQQRLSVAGPRRSLTTPMTPRTASSSPPPRADEPPLPPPDKVPSRSASAAGTEPTVAAAVAAAAVVASPPPTGTLPLAPRAPAAVPPQPAAVAAAPGPSARRSLASPPAGPATGGARPVQFADAADATERRPSVPNGHPQPRRDSNQQVQAQGSSRSGRRALAAAPQVKHGSLRIRTGWWWSRRHFQLHAGHLRWWQNQEDSEKQVDPLGEIALVQGETRWRAERTQGTRLELVCQRGASRGRDGERFMLQADDTQTASDWVEEIGQHIRYVDMLLSWPLPLEGRQGDIRSYGISYPEGAS
uniref:ADF-H domain-containing protein n=1 Tax=Alexandrium catenella TaxID=2925 RepID=A0A7S1MMH2_ALECA